ncbi:unnamed protein product [Didymodactylos carnosus]|uniref:Uncharacterized protein n=1 Tax=Didymodactylos carnosus TaxID=1234261 RepID=A0A815C6D0_9BILA|nr:unnamed protein product [Didymodactylos carnosus]CAF1279428.1 unnamed protein product [Didymodactylos carnosus]CAF3861364.1 unnamed protein product [Didymodactylos carnosus]CAF4073541.1 unnamed protein product [Didymodactylos carnosus]
METPCRSNDLEHNNRYFCKDHQPQSDIQETQQHQQHSVHKEHETSSTQSMLSSLLLNKTSQKQCQQRRQSTSIEDPCLNNNELQDNYHESLILDEADNQLSIQTYEKCNVYRDEFEETKQTSYTFLATFLNCSVIVGFDEQPRSEGMRRVIRHIIRIRNNGDCLLL